MEMEWESYKGRGEEMNDLKTPKVIERIRVNTDCINGELLSPSSIITELLRSKDYFFL